jgi:hypothetical protein
MSKISTTIFTLSGTNFFGSEYDALVTFEEAKASSVVIKSSTEVIATYERGVPISDGNKSPTLLFKKRKTKEEYTASGKVYL